MFTGIIQTIATIVALDKQPGLTELVLDVADFAIDDLSLGGSIAVNGACLTVVAIHGAQLHFQVMASTLQCTTLGKLAIGDKVNIERSLRFGDEIGGHLLSGHVQGIATIISIEQPANNCMITLTLAKEYQQYLFKKAYIALDGISLTIQDVQQDQFSVHIIPETLKRTTLQQYKTGDQVNFEIDPQTIAIVDTTKAVLASR